MKRYLLIILFAIPFIGFGQLYYTAPTVSGGTTPYVYDGGWSPPAIWADSLGAIDITDGRALAASTIKILVDTRAGTRSFAFSVTAANGYTVRWGKKETAVNYANNATAERTYDTTKCQRYCVITITKTGSGAITAFSLQKTINFVQNQTQYPIILWIAVNYSGGSPDMSDGGGFTWPYSLQAIWMANITYIGGNYLNNAICLKSITFPSTCTSIGSQSISSTTIEYLTLGASCTLTSNGIYNNKCLKKINGMIKNPASSSLANNNELYSVVIDPTSTSFGSNIWALDFNLKNITYTGIETSPEDHGSQSLYQCEMIDTLNFKGIKTQRFSMQGISSALNHLGGGSFSTGIRTGNLKNDSVPIRLDYANSTFANATPPQYDLSYTKLDTNQMRSLIRLLPTVGSAGSNTRTIKFTGASGAATLSAYAIAFGTAKGWQVLH